MYNTGPQYLQSYKYNINNRSCRLCCYNQIVVISQDGQDTSLCTIFLGPCESCTVKYSGLDVSPGVMHSEVSWPGCVSVSHAQ